MFGLHFRVRHCQSQATAFHFGTGHRLCGRRVLHSCHNAFTSLIFLVIRPSHAIHIGSTRHRAVQLHGNRNRQQRMYQHGIHHHRCRCQAYGSHQWAEQQHHHHLPERGSISVCLSGSKLPMEQRDVHQPHIRQQRRHLQCYRDQSEWLFLIGQCGRYPARLR